MMRMKKMAAIAACAMIGTSALPMRAGAQITTFLYNGSGTQTPQSQGWLDFADNAISGAGTPVVLSMDGATTLDTTVNNITPSPPAPVGSIEAGYSNYTILGTM